MPGRRQKPIDALQDRRASRTAGRGLTLTPPPGDAPTPRAPEGLTPAVRKHWAAFWRSAQSRLVNLDSDLPALRRYFWLLAERERVEGLIGERRLVAGRDGQEVLNPLFRLAHRYTREIWKYEEAFGINPLNRVRLGIVATQHQAGIHDLRDRLDAPQAPIRRVFGAENPVLDLDTLEDGEG